MLEIIVINVLKKKYERKETQIHKKSIYYTIYLDKTRYNIELIPQKMAFKTFLYVLKLQFTEKISEIHIPPLTNTRQLTTHKTILTDK